MGRVRVGLTSFLDVLRVMEKEELRMLLNQGLYLLGRWWAEVMEGEILEGKQLLGMCWNLCPPDKYLT